MRRSRLSHHIDVADNRNPNVFRGGGAITHWVAEASSVKDFYDLAQDLRTLFDGNAAPHERLSAQNDLGLSLAQKVTENPLSQVIMATGVKLIEEHYFKSMSLLEAQMTAFDRASPGASIQPLDIRALYDDESLALIERTISTLDRFAALSKDASNTYIGNEISYSARSTPASNSNSSYVAPEVSGSAQSSGSALGAAFAGAAQGYIDAQRLRQQAQGNGGRSQVPNSCHPVYLFTDSNTGRPQYSSCSAK